MNYRTGALTPPGFYSKQEAVAAKFAAMKGFVRYDLCAGFDGMGIRVTFDTSGSAKQAGAPHNAYDKLIPQTGQHVRYAKVDGVEVFFIPD